MAQLASSIYLQVCSFEADESTTTAGMKLALSSINEAQSLVSIVTEYLPDVKVIHVQRDNLLDQYASLLRARSTGQWHSWYSVKKPLKGKIEIRRQELETYLYKTIQSNKIIAQLANSNDYLNYNYRQLENREFDPLFEFLELRKIQPDWLENRKVSPKGSDYVLEYDKWGEYAQELVENWEVLKTTMENRIQSVGRSSRTKVSKLLRSISDRLTPSLIQDKM